MTLSGVPGIHLPFEQVLLRQALAKHVHRSDYRKGISFNARSAYGDSLGEKPFSAESDTFHQGSVHYAKTKRIANEDNNDRIVPPQRNGWSAGLDAGTMDVMPPMDGGMVPAPVRCRISKCITLAEPDAEAIARFLQKNCEWKPMPLQALGGIFYERASPRFPPRPVRFNEVGSIPRGKLPIPRAGPYASNFSKPTPGMSDMEGTLRKTTYMGTAKLTSTSEGSALHDEAWNFLRHFPALAKAKIHAVEKKKKVAGHGARQSANLDVLFSDVKALLGNQKEHTNECVQTEHSLEALSALDFMMQVPKFTQLRWLRMLRPSDYHRWDSQPQAIARFLALALAKDPSHFRVMSNGLSDEGNLNITHASYLQLLRQDAGERKTLFQDDYSHGGRSLREVRFTNALKALREVDIIADAFRGGDFLKLDGDRFEIVAKAMDRAESLRLCGGLAAVQDRTQCHQIYRTGGDSPSSVPSPRRGKQLTIDWLLSAIAEGSDDDDLEDGDSIRLLAKVAHPRYAPGFHAKASFGQPVIFAEESANTAPLWRKMDNNSAPPPSRADTIAMSASPESYSFGCSPKESPLPVPFEEGDAFDEDSWVSLNQSLLQGEAVTSAVDNSTSLSGNYLQEQPLGHIAAEGSSQNQVIETDAETFHKFLEIVQRCVGHIDLGDQLLRPLILEALLQHAAQTWPGREDGEIVPGGSKALVSHLLWERCGWDSPFGRHLIRRIMLVFGQYSHHGTLSRQNFLKMAADKGLSTKRDVSAKFARFWQAFNDIVGGNSDVASFADFVRLIERVAYWRSHSFEVSHVPGNGLALISSEARHWPYIEHVVLQLIGSSEKPSAPEWTTQSRFHRPSVVHVQGPEEVAVPLTAEEIPERPSSASSAISEKSRHSMKKGSQSPRGTHKKKGLQKKKSALEPATMESPTDAETPVVPQTPRSSSKSGKPRTPRASTSTHDEHS